MNTWVKLTIVPWLLLGTVAYAGGYGHGSVHFGYHGHGRDGAAVLGGLAIGAVFGYLVSEDRYRYRSGHRRYYSDVHYSRRRGWRYDDWYGPRYRRVVVVEPVVVRESVRVVEPRSVAECLMTREYTSQINVGGDMQPAYGTKCMKPDGSWSYGPPKLVPQFN